MKKFYLLFILLPLFPNLGKGQHYGNSLGLRLGNNDLGRNVGVTFQQKITKRGTLEGIFQSDFSTNTTAHLLYEFHRPLISKRLNYYYGAGVSFGNEESFVKDDSRKEIIHTYGNSTMGADMILGLELTLLRTVIAFDYKPNFNIAGREEFFRGQAGFSVRMVLQTHKELKKKQRQRRRAQRQQDQVPFDEKLKNLFQKD